MMNAFEQHDHDMAQRRSAPAVVKAPKATKAPRAASASGPTKADRALEIFKRLGGDKAAVIAAIKDELSMSDAGATTYFYNAKKLAK